MTTVFQARAYGRFIEVKSILRRKKFLRTYQGSNFHGEAVLVIEMVQETQFNLEDKDNPNILKEDSFSRIEPFIFTSIAPELFDRSVNKLTFPALKSPSKFLPQSAVSRRLDSSPDSLVVIL